jgi:hypothetical protein
MSEQPQKWTAETVMAIAKSGFAFEACERISQAHNAALAAVRKFWKDSYDTCHATLAAERKKRKPLVDALEKIAQNDGIGGYELANIAADVLASGSEEPTARRVKEAK